MILPNAFGAITQINHSQNAVIKINVHFPPNKRKTDDLVVIRLIALGYSAIEIGEIVGLSDRTIDKKKAPFVDTIKEHFNINYDDTGKNINHFNAKYQPEIDVCLKQRLAEFELQKLKHILNLSGAE